MLARLEVCRSVTSILLISQQFGPSGSFQYALTSIKVSKTFKLSLARLEMFFGIVSEVKSKYQLNMLLLVQAGNAHSQLISAFPPGI